ncbi:bifunctional N-succinyldiaminopimelate-aminotransferase/acetylornithine transaminase protein [Candidatus Portiera aleyrodidarum BT-QVLC]|uniref:acetylornithine/succinyldiaminopimelate transaminase n=1 Tax=Candidatus Portiera aleyrodidarum TaxID=91844 RepID=UPI000286D025|nr:acetylornithine/succinyldiaminopimelate transaminase [Candidatus Portiera aleyrodidarum]AFT80596.1 bifunctional N-succinyldiaminopimelate-aminotransferase/acetylornithine transaminase protein [Candidatus Portiera aleyrodidarum BT-QVLC]
MSINPKTKFKDFYKYILPLYSPQNKIPVKGYGSTIWVQDGRDYIDFSGGIAVNALGHSNPVLLEALKEQSKKVWHVSNSYTNEPSLCLAKKLVKNTFADKVFFCSSGAEANEAALKLSRRYAYNHFGSKKNIIISFKKSFHGRTFFTVNVGGKKNYSHGFGPSPFCIIHAEFNNIHNFRKVINNYTCAVIIEPIQGEGGINVANYSFFKQLRNLCKIYNALLIFDEVQCGMGRIGKLFTYMHFKIKPDIITLAKSIGCGFPLAAMLTTNKVGEAFSIGVHGSTYGGNPLACAVGNIAFDVISNKEVLSGVKRKNKLLKQHIKRINLEFNIFKEVRGLGLLIGIELNKNYINLGRKILKVAFENGLMLLNAGPNVLRLAPSLLISIEEIEEGMSRLYTTIKCIKQNFKYLEYLC